MNYENRESVLRVLDANANRAAEGLRTLEDVARLVREDRVVSASLKSLRHRLGEICGQLDRSERLQARSTETDAGTHNTADSETQRSDWKAVVTAATERITQSLRCLEEASKFLSPKVSQDFKQLRYTSYDALAQAELRLNTERARPAGLLYLLIDCARELDEFTNAVRELSAAGVDYFQLRDKAADGGKLVQYARAAVASLRDSSAQVIVNDRVDIALASGAAGVHLGQDDMSLVDARRIAGNKLWIGLSTHDLAQAEAAEREGADYIGCGPTFESRTKSFDSFPGLQLLQQASGRVSLPMFAIGGIGLENVDQVVASGCRRIAVSAAILHSQDPPAAARQLRAALSGVATAGNS